MVSFLHDPNHMYLRGRTLGDLHVYFAYCQPSCIIPSANIIYGSLANIQQSTDIKSPPKCVYLYIYIHKHIYTYIYIYIYI